MPLTAILPNTRLSKAFSLISRMHLKERVTYVLGGFTAEFVSGSVFYGLQLSLISLVALQTTADKLQSFSLTLAFV